MPSGADLPVPRYILVGYLLFEWYLVKNRLISINKILHSHVESVINGTRSGHRKRSGFRFCSPSSIDQSRSSRLWLKVGKQSVWRAEEAGPVGYRLTVIELFIALTLACKLATCEIWSYTQTPVSHLKLLIGLQTIASDRQLRGSEIENRFSGCQASFLRGLRNMKAAGQRGKTGLARQIKQSYPKLIFDLILFRS